VKIKSVSIVENLPIKPLDCDTTYLSHFKNHRKLDSNNYMKKTQLGSSEIIFSTSQLGPVFQAFPLYSFTFLPNHPLTAHIFSFYFFVKYFYSSKLEFQFFPTYPWHCMFFRATWWCWEPL